ncbi:tripartite tricarboxylate transporter permease [Natribacillus halophilus]|uniref:tripartite tricarboxylate transporter permease n=1 Tax=Natribacillus halophilus TaxID=549003 RepID=UPI003CCC04F7
MEIFEALGEVLTLHSLLFLLVGCVVGILFGVIPGLTATMGLALILPFTFALEPTHGLILLMGMYVGGISGGLVAATLLGIPGTPSSIATTFDAYPMSKNGEPVRAMGIGIGASVIGGTVGFIFLIFLSPIIAQFAVQLTPADFASLILLSLSLIAVLSADNMIKGITAGVLGVGVSLVGFAPIDGTARLTFGSIQMQAGVEILPLIMGLFAVAIIHSEVQNDQVIEDINLKVKGMAVSLKEVVKNKFNLLRSTLIGVGLGILPGMGSGASNLIAYAQTKQYSRSPEKFGKGVPEGIYSAESSNNSALGGALIPMLTLGIPGDAVTALLLGGLIIHGIQPGPLLMAENPEIVNVVYWGFFFSILLVFVLQLLGLRIFPRVLLMPKQYLFSFLLVMTVVGTFAMNHRMFDVWVMIVFGIIGYILMKAKYPLAPLVLGFVLGPLFEDYFRRALMDMETPVGFLTSPLSAIFLILTVSVLLITFIQEIKKTQTKRKKN